MTSTGSGARSPAREVLTATLPASVATAAAARSFVVDALRGWRIGTDTLDDAELVVSELVTNAFLHGHATEVAITLADHDDLVRLEVAHHEDGAAGDPLAPLTVGADDTHGRGLAIVDVLAREWGVTEGPGTRRVWADLAAARGGLIDPRRRGDAADRLTALVGGAPDARALGDLVTAWAREHLGTSFAGVALVTADATHLEYLSVVPLPAASAAAWARFPVTTDAPVAAAYREGRAYFHESRSAAVAGFPDLGPALVQARMSALAHLPLCGPARGGPARGGPVPGGPVPGGPDGGGAAVPFGTLALAWEHGRELDATDRSWLDGLAGAVAAAFVRHGVAAPPSTAADPAG